MHPRSEPAPSHAPAGTCRSRTRAGGVGWGGGGGGRNPPPTPPFLRHKALSGSSASGAVGVLGVRNRLGPIPVNRLGPMPVSAGRPSPPPPLGAVPPADRPLLHGRLHPGANKALTVQWSGLYRRKWSGLYQRINGGRSTSSSLRIHWLYRRIDKAYRRRQINLFFTAVFTLELGVNAVSHWFEPFVTDVWSQANTHTHTHTHTHTRTHAHTLTDTAAHISVHSIRVPSSGHGAYLTGSFDQYRSQFDRCRRFDQYLPPFCLALRPAPLTVVVRHLTAPGGLTSVQTPVGPALALAWRFDRLL